MSSGSGQTEDPRDPGTRLTPAEAATLAELTTELDGLEAGRPLRDDPHRSGHVAPRVELGPIVDGGLAPAIAAIVERGVRRRPQRANRLALEVEVKVVGPYPPTRIVFSAGHVLVADGAATAPGLRVEGALTDLVSLLSTPLVVGGVPNPITPRGRLALSKVATGKVRFQGPITLRRELLALLRI